MLLARTTRGTHPLATSRAPQSAVLYAFTIAVLLLAGATTASAGGPRWISGPPYFYAWRVMVSWYTNQPQYFTDAGDLSSSVDHATADAMVAKAAAVWNIPTAALVLAQGGTLGEHVSSANVYATANGLVFPADVQPANYAAKQIAVVYDTDGSITDMLLGSGASDPSGCLQSGVTESVDSITHTSQIQHAILVLNGRCTGPEPEKQLQMQYQLERAFGRILGLGWSQVNDNVFTGSPAPTHTQALNWPIMHPIGIICGPYSYQCLPEPFTLRPDDISALQELYFIPQGQAPAGKMASWTNAGGTYGNVTFPNGQGMEGVNVVVRRRAPFWDTPEDWQTTSSVSGYSFRGQSATSMTSQGSSAAASLGAPFLDREGYWRIQSIPVPASQSWTDLVISTEPINPLYTGPYAIGSQAGDTMSPSGSAQVQVSQYLANGRDTLVNFTAADAAPTCTSQTDGTEGAPAAVPQAGWWTGTLCGYGHHAWSSLAVRANRTLTLEVTALDEEGLVRMTKAMPILGVWRSTDPTGTLPTVASAATAFNSTSLALTSLRVQSPASTSFRIALADQRGAGRPDFGYQARVLYADAVAPASVGATGGTVTITGMGFRQGNSVFVNGIAASVTSWSATSIVATVPSLHDLGLSRAAIVSITVQDVSTGGSSVMTGVLTYAAPVEALELISAPAGILPAGTAASATFSVKAIAPDGFTPIVGEAVSFAATGAGAAFSPCASHLCTVLTDAAGVASASVTPMTPGSVTLTATGRSGMAAASFTATSVADVLHVLSAPTGVATLGTLVSKPLRVQLLSADGVTPRAGSNVTITMANGAARVGACNNLPCTLVTDASGDVTTTVTPMSTGTISLQFASATAAVTASFSAAAETMQMKSAPGGTQTVGIASTTLFAVRVLAGDGITPMPGEAVVFTAAGAAVTFGACGGAVCTLTTDAQGNAQTSVSAAAPGAVTLSAVGNAGALTASFTAVALPDVLQVVSAPSGNIYVSNTTSPAFAVRITAADGFSPVAGKTVTFSGRRRCGDLWSLRRTRLRRPDRRCGAGINIGVLNIRRTGQLFCFVRGRLRNGSLHSRSPNPVGHRSKACPVHCGGCSGCLAAAGKACGQLLKYLQRVRLVEQHIGSRLLRRLLHHECYRRRARKCNRRSSPGWHSRGRACLLLGHDLCAASGTGRQRRRMASDPCGWGGTVCAYRQHDGAGHHPGGQCGGKSGRRRAGLDRADGGRMGGSLPRQRTLPGGRYPQRITELGRIQRRRSGHRYPFADQRCSHDHPDRGDRRLAWICNVGSRNASINYPRCSEIKLRSFD